MRKSILLTLALATSALALTSCGGSSSSADNAMLFGKVPGIVADFNIKKAELKDKFMSASSEGEAKDINEDYDKLFEKTRAEVETAAQNWSGSTLALESNDEWTVKTPVTVTFDGFQSKSSVAVKYSLNGDVVIAKDITLDEKNSVGFNDGTLSSLHVMLKGYDEDGNEVSNTYIGLIARTRTAEGVIIAAGTPLKLESLRMSDKNADDYCKIKTLKLAIDFI